MITEAVPTTATINRAQLRAARALLGWQQHDLAERASVSVETIKRLESRHEASVSTRLSTARAPSNRPSSPLASSSGGAARRSPRRPDTPVPRDRTTGLYLTDEEIAGMVMGGRSRKWESVAVLLEREGLPRIDPLMGGRYWPAVRAYLDRRHGLQAGGISSTADGEETW